MVSFLKGCRDIRDIWTYLYLIIKQSYLCSFIIFSDCRYNGLQPLELRLSYLSLVLLHNCFRPALRRRPVRFGLCCWPVCSALWSIRFCRPYWCWQWFKLAVSVLGLQPVHESHCNVYVSVSHRDINFYSRLPESK